MTDLAHESGYGDSATEKPVQPSSADPAARRGWWKARWVIPIALLVGYVAQVCFRLSLVTGQDYPVVMPDEPMYLVIARMFAGLPTTEIPGNEVLPGGYALLISPAFRLSQDPVQVYHLIMGINALISSLVLPLAYVALRRLQISRPLSYLFATAAVMLPPVVFYSQFAMADTPLPALVLGWLIGVHGLLSEGSNRRRLWFGLLAGFCAGYCLLTHDRGGVVVALTGLVLLVVLVFGWAPRIATASALAVVAAMFVAKSLMTSWLLTRIDGAHPSQVGSVVIDSLTQPDLLRRTVMRMSGHIWYFVTSTWGLAAVVIVTCVVVVFSSRFSKADRVVGFLMVGLLCGVALAAAAGLPEDHRIDTIVYARYLSLLVPVFFVVAVAILLRARSWKRVALLGGSSVVLTLLVSAVVLELASREFRKSWFILWALPDATFLSSLWQDNWGSFHLVRTTAVALVVLVAVVLLRLLGGRRTMLTGVVIGLALAAFAAFSTVTITDHVTKPNTAWRYGDGTGFLKDAGIRPGDQVVMDPDFRWEIRMGLAYEVIDGRVWTRNLTKGVTPPAEANVALFGLYDPVAPPAKSWPNAPAGWHIDRNVQQNGYVVWRRD
ncbi:hypothetical protein [Kitasatospora sp. NPDC002040]|uniref:hypothetical protein n=1 Tax=Kitasatospora sp. NPDC002040 TaxID=3154661 RepID=UPI0033178209